RVSPQGCMLEAKHEPRGGGGPNHRGASQSEGQMREDERTDDLGVGRAGDVERAVPHQLVEGRQGHQVQEDEGDALKGLRATHDASEVDPTLPAVEAEERRHTYWHPNLHCSARGGGRTGADRTPRSVPVPAVTTS